MKLAVISCWKYRDAWTPCVELIKYFWPSHPPIHILTDEIHPSDYLIPLHPDVEYFAAGMPRRSWCAVLGEFIEIIPDNEPILLLQEDFLLTAPVKHQVVMHGLELLTKRNAACVRLYPMPGSDVDTTDPYYGLVGVTSPYRISCQAAIWNPEALGAVASRFDTPEQFELAGTAWASENIKDPVYAFKREVEPWPIEYICSAITRGRWDPNAKKICDQLGIQADFSLRPFLN